MSSTQYDPNGLQKQQPCFQVVFSLLLNGKANPSKVKINVICQCPVLNKLNVSLRNTCKNELTIFNNFQLSCI